ncbi:hypothetical protein AVEN_208404-1, partial [Araneus ventricosus]
MRRRRISKRVLASLVGIVMVGLGSLHQSQYVPPTGGVGPLPGDWLPGLRPQYSSYCNGSLSESRRPWQNGVTLFVLIMKTLALFESLFRVIFV